MFKTIIMLVIPLAIALLLITQGAGTGTMLDGDSSKH